MTIQNKTGSRNQQRSKQPKRRRCHKRQHSHTKTHELLVCRLHYVDPCGKLAANGRLGLVKHWQKLAFTSRHLVDDDSHHKNQGVVLPYTTPPKPSQGVVECYNSLVLMLMYTELAGLDHGTLEGTRSVCDPMILHVYTRRSTYARDTMYMPHICICACTC